MVTKDRRMQTSVACHTSRRHQEDSLHPSMKLEAVKGRLKSGQASLLASNSFRCLFPLNLTILVYARCNCRVNVCKPWILDTISGQRQSFSLQRQLEAPLHLHKPEDHPDHEFVCRRPTFSKLSQSILNISDCFGQRLAETLCIYKPCMKSLTLMLVDSSSG